LLNKKYLQFYFLFVAIIFSAASSFYLSGGTAHIGLFPELYYYKHISLILLALFGILIFVIAGRFKMNKIFIFIIPYIFYLFVNYIIFFQLILFLIATTLFSYMFNVKTFLDRRIIYVYFIIILTVPLIDILLNNSNFIFNSFYGRERLLLGYFHPKEAGIMFVILFLMIMLSSILKNKFSKLLFYISSFTCLYFIQSRNTFLLLLNFVAFNFLTKKLGLKVALLIYFFIYIFIPSLILYIYFDELDLLMSYRLSVWIKGFEFNLFGKFLDFSNYSQQDLFNKFHIDNFYLEFLIEAGVIAFLFLIVCFFYIGYKIRNTVINGYRMISFYIAFLIFCFFDSGMFSTGNFLNIFAWSIIIFLIRERRKLDANNLR
jgi:hypothetical protein